MAFTVNDALQIVLQVARSLKPNRTITGDTRFVQDLKMDGVERRRFYIPTRNELRKVGFTLKTITANNMGKYKSQPVNTLAEFAAAIYADRTSYP